MKKRNIKGLFVVVLLLLITASCSDIINQKPVSSISASGFWQTPSEAVGALNGMYVLLRKYAPQIYMLGAARSEELKQLPGTSTPIAKVPYFKNILSPANMNINWLIPYKIINVANSIIKFVPDIEFSNQKEKNKSSRRHMR